MCIIDNNITAPVLALDSISSVCAIKLIKRFDDRIRIRSVKICTRGSDEGIVYIVFSRNKQMSSSKKLALEFNIEVRKSVNKLNIKRLEIGYASI